MLTNQKPSLEDAYLEHVGIKGMKWGIRKDRSSSTDPAIGSGGSGRGPVGTSNTTRVINLSTAQKTKIGAAVGATAVAGALYATGNLKAATIGGSKLALQGSLAAARVVTNVGAYTVKTAFQTAGIVLGTTAKGVGNVAAKTIESVSNAGRPPASNALKRSGFRRVADVAAKLKPNRAPRAPKIPKAPKQLFPTRSLFPERGPKPALQLHPTTSIFGNRASTKVSEIGETNSGIRGLAARALGRGGS